MNVKFKFDMPSSRTDDLDPSCYDGCDTIQDLKACLLDECEMPAWDVTVDKDDLDALWAEVEKRREES